MVGSSLTLKYEGKGFRKKKCLKRGSSLVESSFTQIYEGKGFRKRVLKAGWHLVGEFFYMEIRRERFQKNIKSVLKTDSPCLGVLLHENMKRRVSDMLQKCLKIQVVPSWEFCSNEI